MRFNCGEVVQNFELKQIGGAPKQYTLTKCIMHSEARGPSLFYEAAVALAERATHSNQYGANAWRELKKPWTRTRQSLLQ